MGNCLRNRRQDPILMSDEGSPIAIGQNQPLIMSPEVWRTDIPMTEGQLKGRRDTFWETAPAYDGRCEIWDALKAACEAVGEEDYALAQAIIDGANISLPTGRLVEAYDELGNRYVVPRYCISKPLNIVGPVSMVTGPAQRPTIVRLLEEEPEEPDSTTRLLQGYSTSMPAPPSSLSTAGHEVQGRGRTSSVGSRGSRKRVKIKRGGGYPVETEGAERASVRVIPTGDPVVIKIRVSTLPKDIRMTIQASDRVKDVKKRLEAEHNVPAQHITMLYSGRVLRDGVYLKTLDIPKGFLIQAIVT